MTQGVADRMPEAGWGPIGVGAEGEDFHEALATSGRDAVFCLAADSRQQKAWLALPVFLLGARVGSRAECVSAWLHGGCGSGSGSGS